MTVEDEQRLYEEHVMRHFEEPYHRGRLNSATHRRRVDNVVCGDSVQVELQINAAGRIEQAWFTGTGCIISQASASMLTEYIEGQSMEVLRSFTAQQMLDLFRARLTPRRQQCCLLAWQALRAMRTIDADSNLDQT